MDENEIDREVRKTLRDIFEYIGIDKSLANDATLRTYLERLIRKVNED